MKEAIATERAPAAIGPYSQAVTHGGYVYISGQIPLDPESMTLVSDDFAEQTEQVLTNLTAVAEQAGGGLDQLLQITVYLTDMDRFPIVNEKMSAFLEAPYPARAAVGVSALPKGAQIEMTAIMALNNE